MKQLIESSLHMVETIPGHQNLILERRGIDQLLAFVS